MADRPQTPVDALTPSPSDAEPPPEVPAQGGLRRADDAPSADAASVSAAFDDTSSGSAAAVGAVFDDADYAAAHRDGDGDGYGYDLGPRITDLLVQTGRTVADHAPDLTVGAVATAVIVAGGWLVAAALSLAVWTTAPPTGGSVATPLHVAGQLWLAAHHVLLQTPDGPFGLSPLGFTILPGCALVLAGRYTAHRFDAGLWSLAAVALAYPLGSLIIAWGAASGPLHADVGAAIGYPFLVACVGYGAGLLSVRALSLERWAATAVRAGTAAFAVLVCGAALTAVVAVGVHFADIAHTGTFIGQGAAGDFGLFLIDLALVPNLTVWTLGFVSGPGFAVGAGSSVSVWHSTHGALPGLPVLQAVPHAGAMSAWTLPVLAVPAAAGAILVLIVGRSLGGLVERVSAVGTALLTVTAAVGACSVLSGGPVAAGSMSAVGPVPWQVAFAVLGELAAAAVLGFGLWYAIDHVQAYRATTRSVPVPVPESVPEPAPAPEPLALPRVEAGLTPVQDDGAADEVGEGLPVAGPEGPQEADEQGQVEQVGEVVADGERDAEPPAVAPPDDAQAEQPLPEAGAGDALADQVQQPDHDGGQDADGQEAVVRAAADGEGVRIDDDGGAVGVGEDDADGVSGSGDEGIDDGRAEPSAQ